MARAVAPHMRRCSKSSELDISMGDTSQLVYVERCAARGARHIVGAARRATLCNTVVAGNRGRQDPQKTDF